MTVMGIDVSLPPGVNVITGFQLFPINLIGKHSHFPLIIDDKYANNNQIIRFQISVCVLSKGEEWENGWNMKGMK